MVFFSRRPLVIHHMLAITKIEWNIILSSISSLPESSENFESVHTGWLGIVAFYYSRGGKSILKASTLDRPLDNFLLGFKWYSSIFCNYIINKRSLLIFTHLFINIFRELLFVLCYPAIRTVCLFLGVPLSFIKEAVSSILSNNTALTTL